MEYQSETAPFQYFWGVDGSVNNWWKLGPYTSINSQFAHYITEIVTAVSSSAGIECGFFDILTDSFPS